MNKIWFSGIAVASIMALVACGNGSTSSNTGGSGGTTSNGGGGSANGGGGSANGGGGSGGASCMECACQTTSANGGCSDICTMGLNGTMNPNFCDGSAALSQCSACIVSKCGVTDPTQCN